MSLFFLLLLPVIAVAVTAPVGTTILGCIAIGQIRRSAGKLHGLGLALFDALLFPLLAVDGVIVAVWSTAVKLYVDFYVNAANFHVNNPTQRFDGFLFQHQVEIVSVGSLATVVLVDFLLIRWAWRAVNKPVGANGGAPIAVAPWRGKLFFRIFLMLATFGVCLFGVTLWKSSISFKQVHDRRPLPPTPLVSSEVEAKRSKFPQCTHTSINNRSALIYHDDVDLHYALYCEGSFDTSGCGSHNTHSLTWIDNGSIHLRNGRTFGLMRESTTDVFLRVNGQEFDLRQGRVLVLHDDGTVAHLALFPSLAVARDVNGLAKLVMNMEQVETPSSLPFGPVIEPSLKSPSVDRKNAFIDLDTGTVVPIPTDIALTNREVVWAWAKQKGVDAVADTRQEIRGLCGFGMTTARIRDEDWEQATREILAQAVGKQDFNLIKFPTTDPLMQFVITANTVATDKNATRTYAFRTREGSLGILQLVDFTDEPGGYVKFRYKLVANVSPPSREKVGEPEISRTDVAWGNITNGLQLGIRYDFPQPVPQPAFTVGETVHLRLYLRNSRTESVFINDYSPLRGWVPELLDAAGKRILLLSPRIDGPVTQRQTELRPAEEWWVGDLSFDIPALNAGRYSLHQNYRVTLVYGGDEISLTSGTLSFEIRKGTALPPAFAFGPVTERVIPANNESSPVWFDVASGRTVLDNRVADFAVITEPGRRGLSTMDTGFMSVALDNAQWDTVTPDTLVEELIFATTNSIRLEERLPQTYAFKTRKDDMGVLQILNFNDNPRSMRFRYKVIPQPH